MRKLFESRLKAVLVILMSLVLASALFACSGGNKGEESPGESGTEITESGEYDSKDDVAAYISKYGKLPGNYITKGEARKLGWRGGSLEEFAPGKAIGGDRFGNREKKLPMEGGRTYYECDIDTVGEKSRGPKRLVYSNDGLIFYTDDHYNSFVQLE